ncbi:MAG: histidine phosphatase family protein [Candidatus Odinarchaeota archaeon]
MDIDKIWKEADWTSEARQIIEGLKKFPDNSKILLILRHSQRDEPEELDAIPKLRLTPEGHMIARKFGEELPKNRTIRLFHSVIWRCQETAEDILSGFKNIDGEGEILGSFGPLFDLGTARGFFPNQMKKYSGNQFFFRWIAGLYSPNEITPLQEYSKKAAELFSKKLKGGPERNIDIHITHDFILIALRFGWFGIPPSKNWVSYLGGFALSFIEDKILLLNSNKLISVDFPYWWKNT